MNGVKIPLGRRRHAILGLFVGAVPAAFALAANPAGANTAVRHATASHQTQETPSTAVQLFASQVETLGADHYANSFAGAVLTPTGIIKVYALPASDGALIRAINTINRSRYPVEVLAARRSYNQLNALIVKLIAANNAIKTHGVTLSQAAPDPASGAIMVSVVQPTASEIAKLSADPRVRARLGAAITASNYRAAVSALLQSELGQGFTVESRYLPTANIPDAKTPRQQLTPDSRTNDTAPFFGGDSIAAFPTGLRCTGAFFVTGNVSGNAYLLTAGHCSQNDPDDFDIYPTGTAVGPVSTNYWVQGTTNDFLTIRVPGGGLPYVWYGSNTIHSVAAELLPAVGAEITFDGTVTGEVPHNTVTAINATDLNVRDSTSGRVYNISPVVQATPPSATVSCQLGDSGGPAYQRTPNSAKVDAVGTIAAFFGAPGITLSCSAQQIGYEENTTHTTLMTTG